MLFLGVSAVDFPSFFIVSPTCGGFPPMLQQLPAVGIGAFSSLYKWITLQMLLLYLNLSEMYIVSFSLEDVIP